MCSYNNWLHIYQGAVTEPLITLKLEILVAVLFIYAMCNFFETVIVSGVLSEATGV